MRVAFVNSMRSFGGGERWLLEVARGLESRGHRVAVAGRPRSWLIGRAADQGCETIPVPMRGDLDVLSIARLARGLRTFRPDLVCASIERAVRIGGAAARLAGVRAVVERRGLILPVRRSLAHRVTYTRLVGHVIANCRAIANSLIEGGLVPESMVSVIPNGIDPGRVLKGGGAAVRHEFAIPDDAPLISVVGRLVADKGHRYAIRAFARVVRDHPGARLLIVGSGGLRAELVEMARRTAPAGTVILAGQRGDVPGILDASDVLLVTSLREGMPHVVLEAMVAGVPIVATPVAGIPEMIEDGRHGVLVPPRSPGATAEAVSRLLSDRTSAGRLAREAARRVRSEFSLGEMIDRVESRFAAEVERAKAPGSRRGTGR